MKTKVEFGAVILVVVTAVLQCQISFATPAYDPPECDAKSTHCRGR
jgi:hypothetical protein